MSINITETYIASAQYYKDSQSDQVVGIKFTTEESSVEHSVLVNSVGNRHYDEIMKRVAAGDLTIADAD